MELTTNGRMRAPITMHCGPSRAQLEVGASIYKEGTEPESAAEVLVLRINSVNALLNL